MNLVVTKGLYEFNKSYKRYINKTVSDLRKNSSELKDLLLILKVFYSK